MLSDASGNAFVIGACADSNDVLQLQQDGTALPTIAGLFDAGWAVQKLGADGSSLWSANTPAVTGGDVPGELRLTADGQAVVAGAGGLGLALHAFAADTGALRWSTRLAEAAGLYTPGLAVGPQGELVVTGASTAGGLFVASIDANRLTRFSRTLAGAGRGLCVAVDEQGRVYVAGVSGQPTNWVTLVLDGTGRPLLGPTAVDRHATSNESCCADPPPASAGLFHPRDRGGRRPFRPRAGRGEPYSFLTPGPRAPTPGPNRFRTSNREIVSMLRNLVRQTILMVASLASSAALMALLVAAGLVSLGQGDRSDLSPAAPVQVLTQLAPQLQTLAPAGPQRAACRAESAGTC